MEDNFDYLADAKKIGKNKIKFKSNAFLRYLKDKLFYGSKSLMDAEKECDLVWHESDDSGEGVKYNTCLARVEVLKEIIFEFNKQLKEKEKD